MNRIRILDNHHNSIIEHEEYLPLRIIFDSSIGGNKFVGFYFGNKNLLELTVDNETSLVKKIQLVLCENYRVFNESLEIPCPEKAGTISLDFPERNDCDCFETRVYSNCIRISISAAATTSYYAMGQVLFGVGANANLSTLIITNVTDDDISHLISELKEQ